MKPSWDDVTVILIVCYGCVGRIAWCCRNTFGSYLRTVAVWPVLLFRHGKFRTRTLNWIEESERKGPPQAPFDEW